MKSKRKSLLVQVWTFLTTHLHENGFLIFIRLSTQWAIQFGSRYYREPMQSFSFTIAALKMDLENVCVGG